MVRMRWLWMILVLMLICLGTWNIANSQNMPENITIDKGLYRTDIYQGVQFKHGAHALDSSIACKLCHHKWDQKQSKLPGKCLDCHTAKGTSENKVPLRDAYMKQCRGCHSNLKLEGKPAGPTRCQGCHLKKKRLGRK